MGDVVAIVVASVIFLAGLIVSALGIGWLGALLCTAGLGAGLILLVRAPGPTA